MYPVNWALRKVGLELAPYGTVARLSGEAQRLAGECARLDDDVQRLSDINRDIIQDLSFTKNALQTARKAERNLNEELAQLKLSDGVSDLDLLRQWHRDGGLLRELPEIGSALDDLQNAQASEVKFRQVKEVNRGLRDVIEQIIVNVSAVVRSKDSKASNMLIAGVDGVLEPALRFTKLGSVATAANYALRRQEEADVPIEADVPQSRKSCKRRAAR